MNVDMIHEGDIVSVDIGNGRYIYDEVRVIHEPCATGDSWVFKDIKSNTIISTSESCTIFRREN